MSNPLQNFLSLPYGELEELNLKAKEQRARRVPMHQLQEERIKYLTDEKRIKAVTVSSRFCCSSIQSRAATAPVMARQVPTKLTKAPAS